MKTWLLLGILLMAGGRMAAQGQMLPPGPPHLPVMKTLTQVEPHIPLPSPLPGLETYPFVITQSGNYYLTQDLVGDPNVAAVIECQAADVGIDLRGFSIRDNGDVLNGTHPAISGNSIRIRNGSIRGGWLAAVDAEAELDARDLQIVGATALGLRGARGKVRDCRIELGQDSGALAIRLGTHGQVERVSIYGGSVHLGSSSRISKTTIRSGGTAAPAAVVVGSFSLVHEVSVEGFAQAGDGIHTGPRSLVRQFSVDAVAGNGLVMDERGVVAQGSIRSAGGHGMVLGQAFTVDAVHINQCGGDGIRAGNFLMLADARIANVGGYGIDAGSRARVTRCQIRETGLDGIRAVGFAFIDHVEVEGSNRSQLGDARLGTAAIYVGTDSLVRDCTITDAKTGIQAGNPSMIVNNIVNDCGSGILVAGGVIRGNEVRRAQGVGIQVSSSYSDIRYNRVLRCGTGIRITEGAHSCLVMGNVLMANHPGDEFAYELSGSSLESNFDFRIDDHLVGPVAKQAGDVYNVVQGTPQISANFNDNLIYY